MRQAVTSHITNESSSQLTKHAQEPLPAPPQEAHLAAIGCRRCQAVLTVYTRPVPLRRDCAFVVVTLLQPMNRQLPKTALPAVLAGLLLAGCATDPRAEKNTRPLAAKSG